MESNLNIIIDAVCQNRCNNDAKCYIIYMYEYHKETFLRVSYIIKITYAKIYKITKFQS